jgi:hypothetical protein
MSNYSILVTDSLGATATIVLNLNTLLLSPPTPPVALLSDISDTATFSDISSGYDYQIVYDIASTSLEVWSDFYYPQYDTAAFSDISDGTIYGVAVTDLITTDLTAGVGTAISDNSFTELYSQFFSLTPLLETAALSDSSDSSVYANARLDTSLTDLFLVSYLTPSTDFLSMPEVNQSVSSLSDVITQPTVVQVVTPILDASYTQSYPI